MPRLVNSAPSVLIFFTALDSFFFMGKRTLAWAFFIVSFNLDDIEEEEEEMLRVCCWEAVDAALVGLGW